MKLQIALLSVALITLSTQGQAADSHPDQIEKGHVVNNTQLEITEVSEDGNYRSQKVIELKDLHTDEGAANRASIITNGNNIQLNRDENTRQNGIITSNTSKADSNSQNIDALNAFIVPQVFENANNIAVNSNRPDQISSQALQNNSLVTTETSRLGNHNIVTTTDLRALQTTQGTTNTTNITQNKDRLDRVEPIVSSNTGRITVNEGNIQTNKTDIKTNKDTIVHNAGGVVDGKNIKSNKQLSQNQGAITTQVNTNTGNISTNAGNIAVNSGRISYNSGRIEDNWQSIQINASGIENNRQWNFEQDAHIDNLYSITGSLQGQIGDLGEYTSDVAAGSMAVASVDFGDVAEGHFSVGFGMGYSNANYNNNYNGWAGAAGVKYGAGEVSPNVYMSVDAKGWISPNGNAAASAGVIFDF